MALPGVSLVSLILLSFSGYCLRPAYGSSNGGKWTSYVAIATSYGGPNGSGTITGGACGYGKSEKGVYGMHTAALSENLFRFGVACGSCYEVACNMDAPHCNKGKTVVVTVTNFSPPGGWRSQQHFSLAKPAFDQIATNVQGGAIPISYRRVTCERKSGIRFTITGWYYRTMVLITNVGGAGDVSKVSVRGSKTGWNGMQRTWGQNWELGNTVLVGQALSFQVSTADGQNLVMYNVAPAGWRFGQTYEMSKQRFKDGRGN